MKLVDFVNQVTGFEALPPRQKICLFAWYLHTQKSAAVVTNASIRDCFDELHIVDPNVATYLPRMAKKPGQQLVRVAGGYKLEGAARRSFDERYGRSPSVVMVSSLLSDLPTKIPNIAERVFLTEALNCYRVQAYRAAIVMTWNLAFDHTLRWVLTDAARLGKYNAAIPLRFPKRKDVIAKIEDFEEFKESETIDILKTASLLSKNQIEILREKLKRRNAAAHPSQVVITQLQADDVISDLVHNIVLALS